jgi:hypothetical protein
MGSQSALGLPDVHRVAIRQTEQLERGLAGAQLVHYFRLIVLSGNGSLTDFFNSFLLENDEAVYIAEDEISGADDDASELERQPYHAGTLFCACANSKAAAEYGKLAVGGGFDIPYRSVNCKSNDTAYLRRNGEDLSPRPSPQVAAGGGDQYIARLCYRHSLVQRQIVSRWALDRQCSAADARSRPRWPDLRVHHATSSGSLV